MTTQPQSDSDLSVRRSRPRWLVPAAALSGVLVLLFVCAVVAIVGGGMAWRNLRHGDSSTAVAVQTGTAQQPLIPGPGKTTTPAESEPTGPDGPAHVVYLPLTAWPLDPQHALLDQVHGMVEIQDKDGVWATTEVPLVLAAGQRVRAGALSSASLTFYDGSTAWLGPASEVSLDELGEDPNDRSRIVRLTQWAGETDHDVAPAYAANGRYEVNTPSGTGVAKGTSFHVTVTPALVVRFVVNEGAVAVTHLQVTVVVVAGQVTTIPVDSPPTEPVFRVTGEGQVTQIGPVWEIAGQTFTSHDSTVIVGDPQVGDWVFVDGHLEDSTRFADRIVLLRRSPANRFTISGEVEAITDTVWTVAGLEIAVDEETELPAEAEAGDLVLVEGVVEEDGTMRAESIRLLLEPGLAFTFAGAVQSIGDEYWMISGVSVTVNADTAIEAGIEVSDTVRVRGQILEDGTWLAESIALLTLPTGRFEFAGLVEGIDPWMVSGVSFETRAWTEIKGTIELGDRVRVEGQILTDGTWVADEIKPLDEDEGLRFEFAGQVESIDPWVVAGVEFEVDENTEIQETIVVSVQVKVEGQILEDGTWLAEEIKLLVDPTLGPGCVQVTGHVVSAGQYQLRLDDGTVIDLDGTVLVDGELLNGSVIAIWVCTDANGESSVISIVVIYQLGPGDTPTPVPDDGEDGDDSSVTICHKPGTKAEKTMTLPRSALSGHLGHGDTMGSCP